MLPDWFLFLFPVCLAASAPRATTAAPGRLPLLWQLMFIVLVLAIGLRHEVGLDWFHYLDQLEDASGLTFLEALGTGDPAYSALNWISANANLDKSIQKLKDEVDKVVPELPAEAKTPQVSDVNFSDQPIQMISVSADLPPAQFAQLGEALKSDLQAVKGVNRIGVSGVREFVEVHDGVKADYKKSATP